MSDETALAIVRFCGLLMAIALVVSFRSEISWALAWVAEQLRD